MDHFRQAAATVSKYSVLEPALRQELRKIVEAIGAPGKGLLAADESADSLGERFAEIGLQNEEILRRDYREMLFSADKTELTQYISGVILNDETVCQKTSEGIEFVEFLRLRNLIPGVKVDKGLAKLFGTNDETTTNGLDDLEERCVRYKRGGCHFAKWRCTYVVTGVLPSQLAVSTNAEVLARYASICQSARMVPIIEPEVLVQENCSLARCRQVHERVLSVLFRALNEHHVYLEGIILKPAMVLAGTGLDHAKYCKPEIIAQHTLSALQRTVPPAVPAIMFLSGGQSDEDSVANLNAINLLEGKKPWTLSFCYGRALQSNAMKIWAGDPKNVEEARTALLNRAKLCSEAALGKIVLEENERCMKIV